MAGSSDTTNLTANSGGRFYVSVSWSETSTSTANNTSTISVTGTLGQRASTETFWSGNIKAGQLSIYWHDNNTGSDVWLDDLNIWEIGYDQSSRSVTSSITVSHKADGTLSGYAKAKWVKDDAGTPYYAPNDGTAETGWVDLTTIPRKVNISSVTGSFTDENLSPTVKWTNNGNRVDLKLEIPSLSLNPWKRWNNLQGSSSYSPTFTQADINDLLSRMPNSSTLTMRFTITTVINGSDSFFSYIDKTFTIVNGEPVFTDFTYADTNATTTAITGNNSVMISGKSTLAATVSSANKAVAQKSATMSKYTFAVANLYADENYSESAITKTLGSPTIGSTELPSGTRDLTVTAIDSRNLSTPVVKSITIVPYDSPMVNATAARVNGFENDTILKISGKFSRIEVNGTAKNTVNSSSGVKYRYKAQSTSTWGSWTNKSVTVDTAAGTITATDITLSLNNQESYDIEVQMTDKLETTTVSLVVSVGQPAFFIGADGRVSVGEMPQQSKLNNEKGLFEVAGRAFANGNRLAEIPIGTSAIADAAITSAKLDWTSIEEIVGTYTGNGDLNYAIKFGSGLMIAVIKKGFTNISFGQWGSVYEHTFSSNWLGNWAVTFKNTPAVTATVSANGGAWIASDTYGIQTTTRPGQIEICRPNQLSGLNGSITVVGIGRWK